MVRPPRRHLFSTQDPSQPHCSGVADLGIKVLDDPVGLDAVTNKTPVFSFRFLVLYTIFPKITAMVVTDFKGPQPNGESRPVASANSGHRQTVPSPAEQDIANQIHELPPPYEPSMHSILIPSTTHEDNAAHRDSKRASQETITRASAVDSEGYQRTSKMTWDEKDANGYWDKYDRDTGACFSSSGGCCFSKRDGCCFSDREACCFSDRNACCFSDRDACCFSDNDACCFSDNGGCCFSGRTKETTWWLIPTMGTFCK